MENKRRVAEDFQCLYARQLFKWGNAIFIIFAVFLAIMAFSAILSLSDRYISAGEMFAYMLPVCILLIPIMFFARLLFRGFAIIVESQYLRIPDRETPARTEDAIEAGEEAAQPGQS